MSRFQLTEEQRQAVENRGGALLVSASAGSGKTRVLVERLFHYVEQEGYQVDDFLIITYTKAAAAELRGRIAEELRKRLAERPDDVHLRRQTARVYKADIKTVDAFCIALLRENVHLLPAVDNRSLTADLRVLDEQEAMVLQNAVLPRVLEEFYNTLEQGDGNALLLAQTLGAGRDDRALESLVLELYKKLQSHPHPLAWLRSQRKSWEELPGELSDSAYGRIIMTHTAARAAFWAKRLRRAAEELEACPAVYNAYGDRFLDMAEQLDAYQAAADKSWDAMAAIRPVFSKMGTVRGEEYAAEKEWAKSIRDACKRDLDKLLKPFSVSAQDHLADLASMSGAMLALLGLTERFSLAYQAEKVRRNCVDFSDQEHYAIEILTDPSGAPTPLAEQVAQRYREVMVDEFQDTNAVQSCIFSAISEQEKHLFAVGDVKQSIYRFRMADPTIFLDKYTTYRTADEASDGEPRRVLLQRNFRSRPHILEAVNAIFHQIMSPEMGEMAYGTDEELRPGAEERDRGEAHAELHVIDVSDTDAEAFDREEMEARFVARRIRTMLDSGFTVQGEDGNMRPVRAEDIVILMRSPRSHLKAFFSALERENVPCSYSAEESFFATVEIAVMVSCLEIIDNPHQDVPLISVLRSPLFGYTPDRLAQVRSLAPGGDFYEALCLDTAEDSTAFLSFLARMRQASREMTVDQLLWKIYTDSHALAIFGAMEEGVYRKNNLIAFFSYAGGMASAGKGMLFDFITQLRRAIELGKAPNLSAGQPSSGVRIMTIHGSKGLEFPVVFLADLQRKFDTRDTNPSVLVHPKLGLGTDCVDLARSLRYETLSKTAVKLQMTREAMAEEMRILYVALTRAKEKLILVDCRRNMRGKVSALMPLSSSPVDAEAVANAGTMGDWLLLALLCTTQGAPLRQWIGQPDGAEADGASWQVHVWENPVEAAKEVADDTAQEKTGCDEPFDPAALEHQYAYQHAVSVPSKVTATQLKGRLLDEEIADGAVIDTHVSFKKPRFLQMQRTPDAARRGTAVHLVMQYLDLSASEEGDVQRQVEELCRRQLLSTEDAEAVDCSAIARFLRSPLAERIRSAEKVYREYRFALLMDASFYDPAAKGEELLLQGVVDCAFETPEGLTVVDFKTDRLRPGEEASRAAYYSGQLEAYAAALCRVLGKPVTERIVYFFATGREIVLEPPKESNKKM